MIKMCLASSPATWKPEDDVISWAEQAKLRTKLKVQPFLH